MAVRGVRGATVATANTREDILMETRLLLSEMLAANGINPADIASIFFSLTHDLNAEFPAIAARELGLLDAPLLCMNELDIPGSLEKCIRILIHWNTEIPAADIQHLYLKEAVKLRPDKAIKK